MTDKEYRNELLRTRRMLDGFMGIASKDYQNKRMTLADYLTALRMLSDAVGYIMAFRPSVFQVKPKENI